MRLPFRLHAPVGSARLPAVRSRGMVGPLLFLAFGCVAAPPPGAGDPGFDDPEDSRGSLRQEEITLSLEVDGVQVRLTPLDPEILRLTAPDTRRRLSSLVPGEGAGEELRVLVSVFTEDPGGGRFEPRSVVLENRGRVYRPAGIRGLTPGWGSTRIDQRQAEQAVYTFSSGVDLELPLTVVVGGVRNSDWSTILSRIDAERARVRARGGA